MVGWCEQKCRLLNSVCENDDEKEKYESYLPLSTRKTRAKNFENLTHLLRTLLVKSVPHEKLNHVTTGTVCLRLLVENDENIMTALIGG